MSRNDIDWDAIERAYRLGTQSDKQLGAIFNVQPSTIWRRSKKFGWVKDKRKDVEIATESLLIQAASGHENPNATPTQSEVAVAAFTAAQIVIGHRAGLSRIRVLRDKMLAEVECITDNMPAFEQLGELLDQTDTNDSGRLIVDKQNAIYRAVISLPDRVDSFKKLVEVDEKVRKGEREAFNIGESSERQGSEELLDSVAKKLGVAS